METAKPSSARETAATWVQYLGMTVAMLGGATWPAPRWSAVGAGLAVLVAGLALARALRGGDAGSTTTGGERPLELAREKIDEALRRTRALRTSASSAPHAEVATAAETIVRECVEPVARAQESLSREHTFAGYARIMTPFASAERWLFRAWSASSDGHRPEAIASLDQALAHLEEAREASDGLASGLPSAATASAE